MGILADRLDRIEVRATSPDGRIDGVLRNRTEARIAFRPGCYRRYAAADGGEDAIADQLAALARLMWVGRTREYYMALSEAFGETITAEGPAVGVRDRMYRSARDELVAEGTSGDGLVYVGVQGMRIWAVRIAPGTTRTLDEDEFTIRVAEASQAMINDQLGKIGQLKEFCYGERKGSWPAE